MWKIGFGFLAALVVVVGLSFFFRGAHVAEEKTFAPIEAKVRHETFKNTPQYVDGMIEELQDDMLAYKKAAANSDERATLKTVIIRQAAKVDKKYLPRDLAGFIDELKSE